MAVDDVAAARDRLLARPVRPVHVVTTTTTLQVVAVACLLVGWSFQETAGAAARAQVLNGQDAKGSFAGFVSLAANGAVTDQASDEGVLCQGGVFLNVTAGSVQGVIYARF